MAKRKDTPATAQTASPPLTDHEQGRIQQFMARSKERGTWPRVTGRLIGGSMTIGPQYQGPDHALLLCEAFTRAAGTADVDIASHVISCAAQTFDLPKEQLDQAVNLASALMASIAPKDEAEGLLAAQMVAAHESAMQCLRRANLPDQTFAGREMNLRFADRFLRTYAAQLEALKKYRNGGQQRVTVEHVHVHQGGQAIVGDVHHAGQAQPQALPESGHVLDLPTQAVAVVHSEEGEG